MSVMDDFTFHPSPAPATSLDSGVSMDQVFTGRVLQPSTEQNKENGIRTDVNKMPSLSPQQVPTTPKLVKPIRMVQTSKKADELPAMVDLVNWRNPPAAFCMMLCGAVLCFTAHYLFGTNAPFLSSASTLLACLLGINFFREAFSTAWLKESAWKDSEFEQLMIDRSKDFIKFVCFTRDQLLCSSNPGTMLRTCFVLMAVRNLSYYVPIWSILAAFWVGMFVVTPFRKQADQAIFAAYGFGKKMWQMAAKTVRMNRLSKIVCISAVLGALMILTDGTSRAMLGLGFLMYIRCSMRTEEIEAWHENKFVETVAQSPLLRSAQKAGKTIGFFADDVLMSAMKSVRNQMGSSASEHTD